MSQPQYERKALLSECLQSQTGPAFESLINQLLDVKEREALDARQNRRVALLDLLERQKRLHELESIFISGDFRVPADLLDRLSSTAYGSPQFTADRGPKHKSLEIEFVNRNSELDTIQLTQVRNQFWVVDAPAGYGKTRLLRRVLQDYNNKGWLCASVALRDQESVTIATVINCLAGEFGYSTELGLTEGTTEVGQALATVALQSAVTLPETTQIPLSGARSLGIAIALDDLEMLPADQLSSVVSVFDAFRNGLGSSGFFLHNKLRVFFSGRYISTRIASVSAVLTLSPFKYMYVRATVEEYLRLAENYLGDTEVGKLSADLMYVTGGHPGLMAAILQQLSAEKFVRREISSHRTMIDHVYPLLDKIELDSDDDDEIIQTLSTLSVFRRFDLWLLESLIDANLIQWSGDVMKLQRALRQTKLVNRNRGFTHDGIVRRLLSNRLRLDEPERYSELCVFGVDAYRDYLALPNIRKPEQQAVEWLYLKLTYWQTLGHKGGKALLEFLKSAIDDIWGALASQWDIRESIQDLRELLREDWELEFFTNYLVSEDAYSDSPYNELIEYLSARYQQEVVGMYEEMDER